MRWLDGLRLLHPHHIVSVIELYKQLTRFDLIVFADVHTLHVSADFGEDGNDVAIDLGIVGRLVRTTVGDFLESPEKNQ